MGLKKTVNDLVDHSNHTGRDVKVLDFKLAGARRKENERILLFDNQEMIQLFRVL